MSWSVLAPLAALAITVATMHTATALARAIRRSDYQLFEDASKESYAREFPIPTFDQSPAEESRKSLSPFVDMMHQAANARQTSYHNAVAGSAGCLVAAFLAQVLGTLPEDDWRSMGANYQQIEHVLTWLDAIAILLVLTLFHDARKANRHWITARAGTELLRQYQFLNLVFPDWNPGPRFDEGKSQFDLEVEAVKARVQEGSISEIISRIERFWSERKASIETRAIEEFDMPVDASVVYLRRRVRRQLGWFADSKARLEHIAERRGIILLSLYFVAVTLSVVKLLWFLSTDHSPSYLLQFLLVLTGMAGAMTAYYINQNARSLIHRYNTQQRRIAEWLNDFDKRWSFTDLPSRTMEVSDKAEMRIRVLEFEDLMIEELIDWVHITSHDAIELAP